jgi:ankyrin repeat protein
MNKKCILMVAVIVTLVATGCMHNTPAIPINNIGNAAQKAASKDLLEAAKEGDTEKIEFALFKGAEVNVVDNNGNTPLLLAARQGHLPAVQLLAKKGADIGYVSEISNETALSFASMAGADDVVQYLMSSQLSSLERKLLVEDLQENVVRGDTEKVRMGLILGANPNTRNDRYWTVLMDASWRGDEDIVKLLLDAGANPNFVEEDGWTALMVASKSGHIEIVKLLHQGGAEIRKDRLDDYRGWHDKYATAVFYALDHPEIVEYLILNGAPTLYNHSGKYPTPLLFQAAYTEHPEAAMKILEIVETTPDDRNELLETAAKKNYIELCQMLLTMGADPYGSGAIGAAEEEGYDELVEILKQPPKPNEEEAVEELENTPASPEVSQDAKEEVVANQEEVTE